jgi:hypothetical protein
MIFICPKDNNKKRRVRDYLEKKPKTSDEVMNCQNQYIPMGHNKKNLTTMTVKKKKDSLSTKPCETLQ